MAKKKTDGNGQGQLEGMPERPPPNPLWKIVRKFTSQKIVERGQEEALKEKTTTRRLYNEKITHTSEEEVAAACQTEALEMASRILDEQVESYEDFRASMGGADKPTFSIKEVTPHKDV